MAVDPPGVERQRATCFELQYLTPRKILLLILVHAYCSASIPGQFHAHVFSLLLEHIEVLPSQGLCQRLQHPQGQVDLMQLYKEKFAALSSSLPHKSVYEVLLELVFPSLLCELTVTDMEPRIFRSISHIYDVYSRLSLFSSSLSRPTESRETDIYVIHAGALCQKVQTRIHKAGV